MVESNCKKIYTIMSLYVDMEKNKSYHANQNKKYIWENIILLKITTEYLKFCG